MSYDVNQWTPFDEDRIYAVEGEYLAKLWKLQAELHNGTDRERDFGHRLHLLLSDSFFKLSEDEVTRLSKAEP